MGKEVMLSEQDELARLIDNYAIRKKKIHEAEKEQEELENQIMKHMVTLEAEKITTVKGCSVKLVTRESFDKDAFKDDMKGWASIPALTKVDVNTAAVKKMYPDKKWVKTSQYLMTEVLV